MRSVGSGDGRLRAAGCGDAAVVTVIGESSSTSRSQSRGSMKAVAADRLIAGVHCRWLLGPADGGADRERRQGPGKSRTTRPGSIWSTSTTTSWLPCSPAERESSRRASRNTAGRRNRRSASATASSSRSGKPPAAGCSAPRRPITCRPARAASPFRNRSSAATARSACRSPARVQVAGRLPLRGAANDRAAPRRKAIEPQVIVTLTKSLSNSATVTGEVVAGARVPLSLERRSAARPDRRRSAARRRRSTKPSCGCRATAITATIPMEALVSDPAENIYAQPGDVLTPGAAAAILHRVRRDRGQRANPVHRREDDAGGGAGQGRRAAGSCGPIRRACSCSASSRRRSSRRSAGRSCAPGRTGARRWSTGSICGDAKSYFLAQRFPIRGQGHRLRRQCRLQRIAEVLHAC